MLQKPNDIQAIKQTLLIGLIFLMAGLSALMVFGELTPLLVLGIVFILSPLMASRSPNADNPEALHVKRRVF